MRALDVLEKIELVSGKNDKIALLQKHNDNKELQELLNAALNFKRKFFIKQFEVSMCVYETSTKSHDFFIQLLHSLETRNITGHEGIEHVEDFMARCSLKEAKWYSRVLRKDLRAGFSISSANKAGFNIPVFDVMLAKDGKQCKKLESIVSKGVYVSPKLDGYRCIAVCNDGNVELFSRNGTTYENFPSIIDSLSHFSKGRQFVLDGEIMSDTFNNMQQSAFASKRRTQVGDVKFYVFGYVSYEEWQCDLFKMNTEARLNELNNLLKTDCPNNILKVQHVYVNTLNQIHRHEHYYMENGFEGAMLLPNIPYYKGKKSNRLMKFKTMKSQDCKVIGVYEGTGKYVNMLGGLHLLQEDMVTVCDIGSGFTDQDRKNIWDNPDSCCNRIVEVKYQELTDDGVMRFPVFVRFRDSGANTGKK